MLLFQDEIKSLMRGIVDSWLANYDLFSEIDSRFGDGDHGVACKRIAESIQENIDNWGDESIRKFINEVARGVSRVGGGSAGPLYGTIFEGFAEPLKEDTTQIDAATLRAMIFAAGDLMKVTTKARQGDKTMMDALLPAVDAAQACEGDIPEILAAAAQAAADGAEATKQMVAKYGRAKFYGEETIGTFDAGALSTSLLFKGLAAGLA